VTGVGAWKIGGGMNGGGLFGAIGFLLDALSTFYGALNALSSMLGKAVPIFNKIVQFIDIAKLVHSLLDKGLKCSEFDAIAFVVTAAALLSILAAETALLFANPVAAFGVGYLVGATLDWLIEQTPKCE
jgi:hypothetical protein